jgi:hypothetical protein
VTRSRSTESANIQRSLPIGTAALFVLLLFLGGGGAPAPLFQALLQAGAFAALLGLFWFHVAVRPIATEVKWSGIFIILLLLLPVLQLVPIPFETWRALPGRELPAEILEASGVALSARPLSLDPEATRRAGLALLPPIAVFLAAASLSTRARLTLIKLIILFALVSGAIGMLQYAAPGTSSLYLFPRAIFTEASGLFANRNFQSDLMLIAILATGYVACVDARRLSLRVGARVFRPSLMVLLLPFFSLALLATRSRTGAALLLPTLLYSLLLASGFRLHGRLIGIAVGGAFAAIALFALAYPLLGGVAERFELFWSEGEIRFQAIEDIRHAIGLHWPLGAGLGTFDPVYRTVESLSVVRDRYLNHAHNDYLEIAMDAGLAGIGLVALFVGAYAVRAAKSLLEAARSEEAMLRRLAVAVLGILLLHSIVDYPLRTFALSAIFAFFCAVLFTSGPGEPSGDRPRHSSRGQRR